MIDPLVTDLRAIDGTFAADVPPERVSIPDSTETQERAFASPGVEHSLFWGAPGLQGVTFVEILPKCCIWGSPDAEIVDPTANFSFAIGRYLQWFVENSRGGSLSLVYFSASGQSPVLSRDTSSNGRFRVFETAFGA